MHRAASFLRTRPPVDEQCEEVGGADGAVDIEIGQAAYLLITRPPRRQQRQQISGAHGKISVQVGEDHLVNRIELILVRDSTTPACTTGVLANEYLDSSWPELQLARGRGGPSIPLRSSTGKGRGPRRQSCPEEALRLIQAGTTAPHQTPVCPQPERGGLFCASERR